jgi:hypothetical protein
MNTDKFWFLNLPDPSNSILEDLLIQSHTIEELESDRLWVDTLHRGELDIAAHNYGKYGTTISDDLVYRINNLYSNFFGVEVKSVLGKIKNVVGRSSITPPHCDRMRHVAINYVIDTGGPDVYTCIYNESRTNPDMTSAENIYHKDVTLDFKIKIPANKWHCYNVQQYHSVENVIDTRLIFSLFLANNPTWQQFQKTYKHLQILDKSG